MRKTDATGVRFEEAKHINKSLSALGNVINALSTASSANRKSFTADSTTQINDTVQSVALSKSLTGSLSKPSGQSKTHIPYRDSKLTRLLQNSLGGNAKTIIILNLSAAAEHVLESISTLKFGDRARQIQTRPQINKTLDDQNALKSLTLAHNEINELRKIIFEQEEEIFALREKRTGVAVQTLSNEDEAAVMTEKSDFPVAICEICRAFVPEKDCREPLQEALLSGLETKPDESKPPKVGLSFSDERASGDDSITGDDDENDENEYGDRCAVCGLNKEDTDQLLLDTGESLGEMFTCDGNCGDQFHVRCVGLVGEAGQYVLPEGEWFCTRCTVGSRGLGETTDTYLHKEQEEEQDNLEDGHMHTATENSLIIAKLRTDYNMMRKERNRVIFQWQQEKNIHKKMELRRKSVQQEADVELIEAQETIAHLQNKLEETEAERDRCSTLFQILMKEFQQRGTSVSYDDLLGARLVTDVLKETLSQSTKISTPIPSCADNDGSSDQVPAAAVSNLPVSDSSPGAKSRNSASAPHPVSPPHVSSAEIPKPWILRGEADRSSDVDNVVWRNTSIVDSSFAAGIHPGGESSKSSITIVGVLGPEAGIESIDDDEDFIPKTFTEKIAKEKSKFINPLKNRLKTLMKAVQDESGSIAEIRQKYQSKDISRNSVQANEH